MLSPGDHLAADELEDPGGMTWREVKDFLDHIRVTCMDERQMWKERARNAERALKRCQDALMRLELDRLETTHPNGEAANAD